MDNMEFAIPAENAPFRATKTEHWMLLLSYFAAYLYMEMFSRYDWILPIFALIFIVAVEVRFCHRKAPWESRFWLLLMAFSSLAPFVCKNTVWEEEMAILFTHVFAIYYVLTRGNLLLDGRTGHFLPLDAIWGGIVLPFSNFFLRIKVIGSLIRTSKKGNKMTIVWSLLAVVVALLLFYLAGLQLTKADSGFGTLFTNFFSDFWDSEVWFKLLFSLPVGAYLYGLVLGGGRQVPQTRQEKGNALGEQLTLLRRVPDGVWTGLMLAFVVLYGVFFYVQGSYLFGAFTRTLPESFSVAEYAREGFFQLCLVMGITFTLLWFALRTAKNQKNLPLGIVSTILLAENIGLAVTAASKLWLYIDCFGFTPLRLQSAWLISVLTVGCICAGVTLWTRKRTGRLWAMLSAALLCALYFF